MERGGHFATLLFMNAQEFMGTCPTYRRRSRRVVYVIKEERQTWFHHAEEKKKIEILTEMDKIKEGKYDVCRIWREKEGLGWTVGIAEPRLTSY